MAREAIVTLMVITCLVGGIAGTMEDGLPRPTNIADAPFASHGPRPEAKYPDGAIANCKWYGFRTTLYSEGAAVACVNELRTALTKVSQELILEPFVYYYLAGETGTDPVTNERYCYEGCFNLDGGSYFSPAPSPGGNFFRGPSLAPSFSPHGSPSLSYSPYGAPVSSPAFAPSYEDPTPAPESGA